VLSLTACGHFGLTCIATLLCLYILRISVSVFGCARETLDECLNYPYVTGNASHSSFVDVTVALSVAC